MSVDLFEHYKDALRRGHVAMAHGDLEAAAGAYREAATLAPDRVSPHVNLGVVLLRMGLAADGLAAFDAALAHAPRDEAGLQGRAEALQRLGRRVDAAESLDLISDLQERDGRLAEAGETTRRALELAEQRTRRRRVADLTRRLRLEAGDEPVGTPGRSPEPTGPDPLAGRAVPVPRPDPTDLIGRAEASLDAGDQPAARESFLAAAAAFDADGLLAAALDACYQVLAFAPDDPDVHLRLVELYLQLGWQAPAADKLALLGRLAQLDDRPAATRARIVGLAADHFPDDPRLHHLSIPGAPAR
jgi:tetratricopeptide (TPR) repeat protein